MAEDAVIRPVSEREIRERLDVVWFVSATSLEDSAHYWPARLSDEPELCADPERPNF